ncbi:hypothetical protein Cus16_2978 [Curtobacterium sp. ER1/6]|nr:hypothetical protein Cus16_2978 [Curtobacterium sp. ER1/6]
MVVPDTAVQHRRACASLVAQADPLCGGGGGDVRRDGPPLHPLESETGRRRREGPSQHPLDRLGDEPVPTPVGVECVADLGRTVRDPEQPDRAEQSHVFHAAEAELGAGAVPPARGDDLPGPAPGLGVAVRHRYRGEGDDVRVVRVRDDVVGVGVDRDGQHEPVGAERHGVHSASLASGWRRGSVGA